MNHTRTILLILLAALVCGASAYLPHRRAAFRGGSSTLNDDLIAYWKLDESSGTRVDSHGSFDLDDNSTVTSTNAIIDDGAYFVNANSEYLSHADDDAFTQEDSSFTFSVWANSVDLTFNQGLFNKWGGAGDREYSFWLDTPGQITFLIYDGVGTPFIRTNNAVSEDTWHLIVAGYDATANELFISVDGTDKLTQSQDPGATGDTSQIFELGSRISGTVWHFEGGIDEAGYWDKALTDEEITELYNSGSGKTCCPF